MPAAYSEPGVAYAIVRANAAAGLAIAANSKATSLISTGSATNGGDVTPGTSPTLVAQVTGVVVPNGAKVIMHCSVQHDVNPPEFGGVNGTAVLYARFNTGGPETVVDSKQEDLVVQAEAITGHNMLDFTTETLPLPAGIYTFDVASSFTMANASDIPVGAGRLTILVVAV
jgi:hypothetical protein